MQTSSVNTNGHTSAVPPPICRCVACVAKKARSGLYCIFSPYRPDRIFVRASTVSFTKPSLYVPYLRRIFDYIFDRIFVSSRYGTCSIHRSHPTRHSPVTASLVSEPFHERPRFVRSTKIAQTRCYPQSTSSIRLNTVLYIVHLTVR